MYAPLLGWSSLRWAAAGTRDSAPRIARRVAEGIAHVGGSFPSLSLERGELTSSKATATLNPTSSVSFGAPPAGRVEQLRRAPVAPSPSAGSDPLILCQRCAEKPLSREGSRALFAAGLRRAGVQAVA